MGLYLERRKGAGKKVSAGIILLGTAFAVLSFSIVFLVAGISPLIGFKTILRGGFGDGFVLQQLFKDMAPLLFVTLAFLLPSRAGLWNIGAEGQFFLGGVGATGIALAFANQPSIILIPMMAIAAMVCAGGWAFLAAVLRARFQINEIVITLFLNWIALLLVKYLTVGGPWMTPEGRSESKAIPAAGRLPAILGTNVPVTIVVAVLLAVLLYFVFEKTTAGFEIKAFGHNPDASIKAGINEKKVIILSLTVGGMLAGLGGLHQAAGAIGRLRYDLTSGWGYYGILFALLAGNSPLWAIIVTLVTTGLLVTGAQTLQYDLGMGSGIGPLFVGVIILCFVLPQFLKEHQIKWR